jgi:methylglutaconyl-CoA hydratase
VRLSELAVGIGPFVVGPVIEHKIGHGHYMALAFDADWRDAAWAARAGLYARTCATIGELDEAVDALARRLAGSNPAALRELKHVCWGATAHWDTLLPERAAISGRLVVTEAAQRAIAALAPR